MMSIAHSSQLRITLRMSLGSKICRRTLPWRVPPGSSALKIRTVASFVSSMSQCRFVTIAGYGSWCWRMNSIARRTGAISGVVSSVSR
jgi:hypothetical protein